MNRLSVFQDHVVVRHPEVVRWCEAAGPATRWTEKLLPSGSTIVGVRLRPGWVPGGLGLPATELLDREVQLRDLWGQTATDLAERVSVAPGLHAKLGAIEEALGVRWATAGVADPLVSFAVCRLIARPFSGVGGLAAALGLSARQLRRRFAAAVGYGPKTFHRIVRFQRLLEIGARRRGATAGTLALEAGYSDQAHMNRGVVKLAGRTPAAMLGRADGTLRLLQPVPFSLS